MGPASHLAVKEPHAGLISCETEFKERKPSANESELLSLMTMIILLEYAYPAICSYTKFTIGVIIETSSGDVRYTASKKAIPLTCSDVKLNTDGCAKGCPGAAGFSGLWRDICGNWLALLGMRALIQLLGLN